MLKAFCVMINKDRWKILRLKINLESRKIMLELDE